MNLDPVTLNRLAHIRQQEILERAAVDHQKALSARLLLYHVGRLITAAGQRIMHFAGAAPGTQATTYPMQETDACAE